MSNTQRLELMYVTGLQQPINTSNEFKHEDLKPMTEKEKIACAYMLRKAADEFGNHGCNDLDDDVLKMFNKKEWRKISKEISDEEDIYVPDWALMEYLADRLESDVEFYEKESCKRD